MVSIDDYDDIDNFLCSEDPEPFEVLNPEGKSKYLLICDHASNAVPKCLKNLGLDEEMIKEHVAWDIGAGYVTRHLSKLLNAQAVLAGYSRIVIDCNREAGSASSILEVSDGIFIPANQNLTQIEKQARLQKCYLPYHQAIEKAVESYRAKDIVPVLFSVHSFTPMLKTIGKYREWDIGILWDRDHRVSKPLLDELRKDKTINVGENKPYSGREESGSCIKVHGLSAGLPHSLIEIRQDLIDTEEKGKKWAEKLSPILTEIIKLKNIEKIEFY